VDRDLQTQGILSPSVVLYSVSRRKRCVTRWVDSGYYLTRRESDDTAVISTRVAPDENDPHIGEDTR
jgi:hypothetical protein